MFLLLFTIITRVEKSLFGMMDFFVLIVPACLVSIITPVWLFCLRIFILLFSGHRFFAFMLIQKESAPVFPERILF